MRYLLLIIGIMLLAFWAIALFFKLFGAIVHLLLVIAIVMLIYVWVRPLLRRKS